MKHALMTLITLSVLPLRQDFALGAGWKRDDLGVSAFIQDAATGEVYQARQRPMCGG